MGTTFAVCGRCGCNQPATQVLKCTACGRVFCSVCGSCPEHYSAHTVVLGQIPYDKKRVSQAVYDLLMAGRKLEAVKLYAANTGCGLKEAKDYVDSL